MIASFVTQSARRSVIKAPEVDSGIRDSLAFEEVPADSSDG